MSRWNKVDLRPLFSALPSDFRLTIADIGSIGGLHKRWAGLADRLVTIGFDPLDPRDNSESDRIFPYLIGDREGPATLNVTSRASMSSTLAPDRSLFAPFWDKPAHVEVMREVEAPMTRLDPLLAREGVVLDAIKIDVQGGEAAVISGAADTLRQSVLLAEIECSFFARYEGQQTFDQVVARMRELGFGLIDVRRLKRYRYKNSAGVRDPSLGLGMRAGRLAFCDAIFAVEPNLLWQRIGEGSEANGPYTALKAMILFLVYGKADMAAAAFDHVAEEVPHETRQACLRFFARFKGDGGWRQRLHHRVDRWVGKV